MDIFMKNFQIGYSHSFVCGIWITTAWRKGGQTKGQIDSFFLIIAICIIFCDSEDFAL